MGSISSKKTPFYWMLLSTLAITLLSWCKFGVTGSIRVDHNPFPGVWGYLVFIVFGSSLLVFGIQYWRLYTGKYGTYYDFKQLQKFAWIQLIIASLAMPLLSNDVFVYLAHGELSNRGVDVFSQTNVLQQSIWFEFIGDWKDAPCVYGPINLLIAKLAASMSFGNIWLALAAYKLIHIIMGMAIIGLIFQMARSPRDFILVAFTPAFWLHNISQVHNDLTGCFLFFTAIYFIKQDKIYYSAILIALAVAAKISYIIYVPFIGLYYILFVRTFKLYKSITYGIASIFLFAIFIIGSYSIFWKDFSTFSVPLSYASTQTPSKTFAEVTGEIVTVLMSDGGISSSINEQVATKTIEKDNPKVYYWKITQKIFNYLGIVLGIITTLVFVIKTRLKFTKKIFVEYFIKMSFVFFFIYLHVFNAWYLVAFMPLLIIAGDLERLKKYFIVISSYSGLHMIVLNIERPSILYMILPIIVLVNICLFLWQFKKNFLTVETIQ